MAPHDRPREKLERLGVGALGDHELIAVLLGHGTRRAAALAVAEEILALAGGVHGLTRVRVGRLAQVSGVGRAQACRVQAAVELGRRTLLRAERTRPQFLTPREIALELLPQYGAHPVERFGVMLLDTKYRLLSTRLISIGSLDTSLANPREVFREALLAGAGVVVAFHNHPSGDPTPSDEDIRLTGRLASAGQIVGVYLADHVVLADTHYCSMRESKLF